MNFAALPLRAEPYLSVPLPRLHARATDAMPPTPPNLPPPSAKHMERRRSLPPPSATHMERRRNVDSALGRVRLQWQGSAKFHDTLVTKAERTSASDMEQLSAIRAGRAEMTPTWGSSLGISLTRPELQRAVPAGGVLRRWSAIFRSTYVEGLYDMSGPTTEIDTFVSHSWRTPGWARALALAWHLSVSRLALAAAVAPLLWAVLAVWLDIETTYWFMPEGGERMIALSFGVGPLVIPLAFLLAAALSIASSATKLYLDRCCMCQYDTALMQASIHQLGAYIARSRRFLILWDENYCSRLWCMYEVATFLALHPVDRLRLVPITSVLPVVALWIFHAAATLGVAYVGSLLIFSQWFAALCQQYAPEPAAQVALLFMLVTSTLCACYACVGWYVYDCVLAHVSALDELHGQLSSFTVANLNCAVESDRAVVAAEIQRMFGSCRRFESLVRNKVAPALVRDLSRGPEQPDHTVPADPALRHATHVVWRRRPQPHPVVLTRVVARAGPVLRRRLHGRRAWDVHHGQGREAPPPRWPRQEERRHGPSAGRHCGLDARVRRRERRADCAELAQRPFVLLSAGVDCACRSCPRTDPVAWDARRQGSQTLGGSACSSADVEHRHRASRSTGERLSRQHRPLVASDLMILHVLDAASAMPGGSGGARGGGGGDGGGGFYLANAWPQSPQCRCSPNSTEDLPRLSAKHYRVCRSQS